MIQADRNDEHLDRKLEILSKGIQSKPTFFPVSTGVLIDGAQSTKIQLNKTHVRANWKMRMKPSAASSKLLNVNCNVDLQANHRGRLSYRAPAKITGWMRWEQQG